jgi:hypothetical protein
MKAKLALLVGAAAGYVLGTRAGRERYEQIKSTASDLWQNNHVQETVSGAESFVTAKAPDMQQKVTEAARSAVDAARSKFSRGDGDGPTDEPSLADSDTSR